MPGLYLIAGRARSAKRALVLTAGALLVAASGCYGTKDPEVHLIPNGYVGLVEVRFDCRGAPAVRNPEGRRVYTVEPSGIARTAFGPNYGRSAERDRYLYVSDGGNRALPTALSMMARDSASTDATVYVWLMYLQDRGGVVSFVYFVGSEAVYLAWQRDRGIHHEVGPVTFPAPPHQASRPVEGRVGRGQRIPR